MSQAQKQAVFDDTYYIFNIRKGGQPMTIGRTWGSVTIEPCPDDAEYSTTEVHGRIELMNSGLEDTYTEAISTAQQIAYDLEAWVNSDCPQLSVNPGVKSFHGVFVSKHAEPTKKELVEAYKKLEQYFNALVAEADSLWTTAEGKKNITSVMREAARYLNIKKEWNYNPEAMDICPACGESIRFGVIKCKSCGAILDREAAKKYGLLPEEKKEPRPSQSSQ